MGSPTNGPIRHPIIVVSLIALLFYSTSLPLRDIWVEKFIRPYNADTYLAIYFLSLWGYLLFSAVFQHRPLLHKLIIAAVVMHLVSLIITTQILGAFYYEDYAQRLSNTWTNNEAFTYLATTFIVGSARSFMIGGWFYGILGILIIHLIKPRFLRSTA